MEENKSENNINKTPSKMARLAWPKAKYGAIIAVLIIIVVNLIYYKDFFLSFFNVNKTKLRLTFNNSKRVLSPKSSISIKFFL